MTTMSSVGTTIDLRLTNDENEKPVMASTWPFCSIGSRTGNPTFSIFTLEASEINLLEQQQVKRLNTSQTNASDRVTLPMQPESK